MPQLVTAPFTCEILVADANSIYYSAVLLTVVMLLLQVVLSSSHSFPS